MKKWIFFLILFVLLIFWQSIETYQKAVEPKKIMEEKAIKIAEAKANLQDIKNITTYFGNKSYTVVSGINQDNEHMIVWVPQKDGTVTIRKASEGISKDEAENILKNERNPKKIIKAVLGMENGVPLWEITYIDQRDRYSFFYIDFKTGKFLKRYSL